MPNGACIVASNVIADDGSVFDYVGLARKNAGLIRKHLDIPVALLTTSDESIEGFDSVVRIPKSNVSKRIVNYKNGIIAFPWDNDHRVDALEYTPWDRTLLVDADYLVLSDHLIHLMHVDDNFIMLDDVVDVTGRNIFKSMRFMPDRSFVQRWATVMVFNKNAKTIFDAARMVKENYRYYATMFNFSPSQFRNDFVFSIASHLLGVPTCPIKLFQSPLDATIDSINDKGLRLRYDEHIMRWNYDLHVLNKNIVIDPTILDLLDV